MGVKISGDKELTKFFNKQPKMIQEVTKKWLFLTSNEIKNEWQGFITSMGAIKTGRYRGSISTEINLMSAEVYSAVEYAAHVEFGTKNMPGRPAMMATVQKIGPKLVQAFTKELRIKYK